jgi:hypothetical protein
MLTWTVEMSNVDSRNVNVDSRNVKLANPDSRNV